MPASRFSTPTASEALLDQHGWFASNSGNATHAVGGKVMNGFGLFDVHGNVGEWCLGWHGSFPGGNVSDPAGPPSGTLKIVRGGNYSQTANQCRSAARLTRALNSSSDAIGFRIVLAALDSDRWIAFNDHAPGAGTHPNTTVYHATTNATGFLRDIRFGASLPAHLTIEQLGVSGSAEGANPAPGTPADNVFRGYVDLSGPGGNGVNIIELAGTDLLQFTFSGLNPARHYRFIGTAIRGNDAYTNRWTQVEISRARAFTASHTPGVLTSNEVPSALGSAQAALNTGPNHTPESGDFAGWAGIQPAEDGAFAIVCRQYTGPVPGGSANGLRAYGLTGVRLELEPPGAQPPVFVQQPANSAVFPGSNAVFRAVGFGAGPFRYQWRRNGVELSGETNFSLHITNAQFVDEGSYDVVLTHPRGSLASEPATLTILVRPFFISQPAPQTNVVVEGGSATFMVEAGGSFPLTFRWRRGGIVFTNVTLFTNVSVVTLTGLQITTASNISLNVTNLAGSTPTLSSNAWLYIMRDADRDGLGDEWELAFGLSTNNAADALLDADGDGLSNWAEFRAGTDPSNAASVLELRILAVAGTHAVVLRFEAAPHKSYVIEFSGDLDSGQWQNADVIAPADAPQTVTRTHLLPAEAGQRFYRVRTPAWP